MERDVLENEPRPRNIGRVDLGRNSMVEVG